MFTPDTPITVTRLEVRLATAPMGCSINARVRLTDGTTAETLTLTGAYESSGSLALDYAAGTPLSVRVIRAASCSGGTMPADANVVVQYRAR